MFDAPLTLAAGSLVAHRVNGVLLRLPPNPWQFALAVASLSLLYLMHYAIWFAPAAFAKACARAPLRYLASHPVEVFARLEMLGKLWHLATVALFLGTDGIAAAAAAAADAPMWCWRVGALYVLVGQGLNVSIYRAIGNAGVYYGFKLGRPVPWCTSFPFNVGLRHPQYVGVVLTLFGILLPLASDAMVLNGFVQLIYAWAAMYALMSVMEQLKDACVTGAAPAKTE